MKIPIMDIRRASSKFDSTKPRVALELTSDTASMARKKLNLKDTGDQGNKNIKHMKYVYV